MTTVAQLIDNVTALWESRPPANPDGSPSDALKAHTVLEIEAETKLTTALQLCGGMIWQGQFWGATVPVRRGTILCQPVRRADRVQWPPPPATPRMAGPDPKPNGHLG